MNNKCKDADIRRTLGLPSDVPIRRNYPTKEELARQPGILEKVANSLGLESWMWRSPIGVLIALIIIPPVLQDIDSFWTPRLSVAYECASPYVKTLVDLGIDVGEGVIRFGDVGGTGPCIIAPSTPKITINPSALSNATIQQFENLTVWHAGSKRAMGSSGNSVFSPRVLLTDTQWFSRGSRISYFTLDPINAFAEIRLHMGSEQANLVTLASAVLTTGVVFVNPANLSMTGDKTADFELTRSIGHAWLQSGRTCLLGLPSRTQAGSYYVALNWDHPAAASIALRKRYT